MSSIAGYLSRGARAFAGYTAAGAAAHLTPSATAWGIAKGATLIAGKGTLATVAAGTFSLPATAVATTFAMKVSYDVGGKAFDYAAKKTDAAAKNLSGWRSQSNLNNDPIAAVGSRSRVVAKSKEDGWEDISLQEQLFNSWVMV